MLLFFIAWCVFMCVCIRLPYRVIRLFVAKIKSPVSTYFRKNQIFLFMIIFVIYSRRERERGETFCYEYGINIPYTDLYTHQQNYQDNMCRIVVLIPCVEKEKYSLLHIISSYPCPIFILRKAKHQIYWGWKSKTISI